MEDDIIRREAEDEKLINDAYQRLLDTYMASRHRKKVDIIKKAFNFAKEAHKGVRRLSGEPYIMHPIAVAQIAAEEVGLGSTSICAALLHDVVEDTDYTVEDIDNIFGTKVAQIVDGLTKISGGIFGEQASAQAENFKKLLLTMSDDIRVILIKICDRMHNMRTLASQPANKKYKIAGETLYIYAPLANRLGLYKIKTELEDLSFRYEHPEEYASIEAKLASTQASRHELFDQFTAPIRENLDKMGVEYTIKERVKTPYSIWNKMQHKHVPFDEIYDILAVRIIFTPKVRENEISECFNVYIAISQLYKAHPDRLRDWLNHPKANGYQALHVTLMSKQGRWIEVQIRSDRMNEVAEQGFASHWKYKDGIESYEVSEDEGELNDWLRTIKEILDDPQPDAMDFLDSIKLNLFASEIFVFTPKGEIKTMPVGCTALDFDFHIHTFLGSHCIGAKINHKLVPLSHKLQSGDQIEILTSKSQHVQPSWINFVSTAKAKSKIQAILRRDRRELQKRGEQILEEFIKKNELTNSAAIIDTLAKFHDVEKREDFLCALGQKTILLGDEDLAELMGKRKKQGSKGWRKFVPFLKTDNSKKSSGAVPAITKFFVVPEGFNRKKPIIITDDNISQYKFKRCCHPIPGDDILGFIDNKKEIEIHKRACPIANKLKASFGNRILDAKWDMGNTVYFDASIRVQGIDRLGMINDVTMVISKQMNVNIRRMTISCEENIFDGTIDIRVHDKKDVKEIMKNLKGVEGLQDVTHIM